ncbi:MAG: hypothetical protein QOE70_5028 [Chthoniobacter sp.]|nr:hypothetical protein [Chthoniobacter sp.]
MKNARSSPLARKPARDQRGHREFSPRARPRQNHRRRSRARARNGWWDGKWSKAEIIAARDGKYQVTWPGWDKSYDSWLTPENLRPSAQKTFAKDATVEIEWGSKWYPGKVVRSELGLLLVHYDGYTAAADDEWVPLQRVRQPE